jgi:hypothetical protein
MDKTTINGVELTLMAPVATDDEWVDYGQYLQQLQAALLRLSKKEPPLNPRLISEPGLGKKEPFRVQRSYRELSLITLDAPTWLKADDSRSLYGKVIKRLLESPPRENNLCGWLRIMFGFCRNKPLDYYSHYQPGPRVHAIAREFGARIIYVPLTCISRRLLERHQSFQFMNLTRAQWEELLERISESKRAWVPSALENDVAV